MEEISCSLKLIDVFIYSSRRFITKTRYFLRIIRLVKEIFKALKYHLNAKYRNSYLDCIIFDFITYPNFKLEWHNPK